MAPASIWSETPLHTAAGGDDLAALELALAAVASSAAGAGQGLAARDVLGFTPLHVAACEASGVLVGRLLAAGAAVDARRRPRGAGLVSPLVRGEVGDQDRRLRSSTMSRRRLGFAADPWEGAAAALVQAELPSDN